MIELTSAVARGLDDAGNGVDGLGIASGSSGGVWLMEKQEEEDDRKKLLWSSVDLFIRRRK